MKQGGLVGKKAMLSFSTGCYENMVGPNRMLGSSESILWPLQFGTFAYTGMSALPANIFWYTAFVDDAQSQEYLDNYATRLRTIENEVPIPFHPQTDFDYSGLKPDITPLYSQHKLMGKPTIIGE